MSCLSGCCSHISDLLCLSKAFKGFLHANQQVACSFPDNQVTMGQLCLSIESMLSSSLTSCCHQHRDHAVIIIEIMLSSSLNHTKPSKKLCASCIDQTTELYKAAQASKCQKCSPHLAPAAAEVAETYSEKQVTLVQANKELVPGYSARLSRQILNILQGLNVEASLHSESIAGNCHV